MMRPKSAFYYIEELEDIAQELAEKIGTERGPDGDGIKDIHPMLQAYALEAVGCIFLDSRLGAIKGEGDGRRLIELADEILPIFMKGIFMKLFIIPPALFKFLPIFKHFIKLQSEMFDTCKKHVDAALERVTDTDDSVIAKLVRTCGKDSPIPLIMGIDALQVGIDTTGTTATCLFHHLAINPEKQEKLYQEILEVLGPEGKMTEAALARMRYLKACQTESQRILPAIFGTNRTMEVTTGFIGRYAPHGAGSEVNRLYIVLGQK